MIVDGVLFPVFLGMLYALGAGALPAGRAWPAFFYPLCGLCAIGFAATLVHFVAPVTSPALYLLLVALLLVGLWRVRRQPPAHIGRMYLLALILAPLATAMPPGLDAGLYHLPHQLWLREEKIIFGLANIHGRFGFSSFMEYIAAPLWVAEHFKLVAYATVAFVYVWMLFLYDLMRAQSRSVVALGMCVLFSAMFFIHEFKFGYTSTDTSTAILFTIAFLYGLQLLLKEGAVTASEWTVLFTTALLCVMFKVSSAVLGCWVLFVIARAYTTQRTTPRAIAAAAIVPCAIGVLWLARGIITSGCALYPVAASCVDVPWAAAAQAAADARGVTVFARYPKLDLNPIMEERWFISRWLPYYLPFVLRVLIQCLCVAALYRYLTRTTGDDKRAVIIPGLAFACLSLALWLIYSPAVRFGLGIFIILPPLVALALFGVRAPDDIKIQRGIDKVLALLSRIGFRRWGNRERFMRRVEKHGLAAVAGGVMVCLFAMETTLLKQRITAGDLWFQPLATRQAEGLTPRAEGGFSWGPSGECFTTPGCGPAQRPEKTEKNGYSYFLPSH